MVRYTKWLLPLWGSLRLVPITTLETVEKLIKGSYKRSSAAIAWLAGVSSDPFVQSMLEGSHTKPTNKKKPIYYRYAMCFTGYLDFLGTVGYPPYAFFMTHDTKKF